MTKINLREFYPWYLADEFVDVSDEVAAELRADKLYEAAHRRRLVRNKAQYSLDREDGIEYADCQRELSPQEVLDRKERFFHLWNALNSLPETQGRRVDAYLILGKTYREIALEEGIDKSTVRESVRAGMESMKKYLKKVL